MQDIINREEILKLNRNHLAIHLETPKKVFGDLFNWLVDRRQEFILDSKGRKQRKMLAYLIDYFRREDGSYDFDQITEMRVVDGDEWITLPVRPFDLYINTPKKQIRVPRVVISLEYDKDGGKVKQGKSYNAVYDLYDGICAYTKRKLKRNEGSRDHVVPLSRGGLDELPNLVLSDKRINNTKGNRLNHEIGLPDVVPISPKNLSNLVRLRRKTAHRNIPEWKYFLGD